MPTKIDPDNPATVPEKYRNRIREAARRIQPGDPNMVMQMLVDLIALAQNDGCVAAGWAFDHITKADPDYRYGQDAGL